MPTERLTADDCTNLVAIDVDVARGDTLGNMLHPVIDAGVQTKRQAIACRVYVRQHLIQIPCFKGRNMQDGAKHFACDVLDPVHFDQRRSAKRALGRDLPSVKHPSSRVADMRVDRGFCLRVDHGPDVRGQRPGVTDAEAIHCAFQHLDHLRCDILLDIKAPQRGTPLARRLKGAFDNRCDRLFRQRRAVDHHRVQPAGLRDQRRSGLAAGRKRRANGLRRLCAPRKGHGIRARRNQGCADLTVTWNQLQRCFWHARVMKQGNGQARD